MTYYRYRFSFGYGLTPMIKNLIVIMVAVFLLQNIVQFADPQIYFYYFLKYFALIPEEVWKQYYIWQLFTYIFLHGGVFHLLFNLLALWMFGGELENYWGSKKFLQFFLVCGIAAGICTVLFTPEAYQPIPVIGASGAIYGLLLAFGWLFPNRPIYIYFLFPIPAKYFVIIFGLIELYLAKGAGGGIAHITHLGGLLFALIYMAYPTIRQKLRREYYKRKWSQKGPGSRDYYH